MLKRAQARRGVERAEALPVDLTRVLEVDLEPVLAAGRQLRRTASPPPRHHRAPR